MIWILGAMTFVVALVVALRRHSAAAESRGFATSSGLDPGERRPPSALSVAVRLFADDVAVASLPLSVSIETMGGVSTVLLPRGTALPTARRETFATAVDNQRSIEVHVLIGDHTLVADNVTVGKFAIVDIPAVRYSSQFEVELAVDTDGTFRFSARSRGTGQRQAVSMSGHLVVPLSSATIERMLDTARAEESLGEYGTAKTTPEDLDSVTVYTQTLRDLVEATRRALENGSQVPEPARTACEEHLRNAERLLEANARPERASAKLNVIKADELEQAILSLREAAKRCR